MANSSNGSAETARKFGTFGGVFVPDVLTILGVILKLRTGWVVGNAGLRNALIILVIANCITLLTSLSLSVIATNARVGGGGAYYMISRRPSRWRFTSSASLHRCGSSSPLSTWA